MAAAAMAQCQISRVSRLIGAGENQPNVVVILTNGNEPHWFKAWQVHFSAMIMARKALCYPFLDHGNLVVWRPFVNFWINWA
jgi:hypothetical protein